MDNGEDRPRLTGEELRELIYRLDGPLRWAMGENYELAEVVPFRPGQRVLDVGAGTGYLTIPLAARVGGGGRVDAVDVEERLLARLAEKANRCGLAGRVVCTTAHACDLPFNDETFDFVYSGYLLHELGDHAPEVCAEMYRVLRPLGRLVLADFRRVDDEDRRREIESWYGAQQDGGGEGERHLRFSLADAERMLRASGFRDINVATWKEFHMHITSRRVDNVEG